MAVIAQWNGHTFEVGSKLIRGFTELSITGGCETTDKNTDKQKYKEHKYGEAPKITLTVQLNALTGVTNVWSEAMQYIDEAAAGATDYFYTGGYKLVPAKMMLTKAQVSEIVMMPGRGDEWISADVQLTFEQGTKLDGSSGGGGKGGKGKVNQEWKKEVEDFKKRAAAKNAIKDGKKGSGGLDEEAAQVAAARESATNAEQAAATQARRDSGVKVVTTTGKSMLVALPGKITPSKMGKK